MRNLLCAVVLLAQTTPQTAGERYKSIRVLKEIPASQVIEVMSVIAGSLGVTCVHCHTDVFVSDEKPMKEKARQMILMTRRIDQEFGGRGTVTCNTCHQGHAVPPSVSLVANAGWNKSAPPASAPLPSLDDVINRYTKAVGNLSPLEPIASRSASGSVTRNSGRTPPVSDKYVATFPTLDTPSVKTALSYPPEANAEWPLLLIRPAQMRDLYPTMAVTGRAAVGGNPAVVIRATTRRGAEHQLFFDESSGLLVRRYAEKPTVLGPLPEEFDFEDYREAQGVRLPHRLVWSRADYRVTFTIDRVQ